MAKTKLTDLMIRSLKPGEKRIEYFDKKFMRGGSLSLLVYPSGQKTFFAFYRVGGIGRLRRYKLGGYPCISLADARKDALGVVYKALQGEDPGEDKKKKRRAETFREVAEEYVENYAKKKKANSSALRDEQMLDTHLLPEFGSRKMYEINRKQIKHHLNKIAESTPVLANRLKALLSKVFNYALSDDIEVEVDGLEFNPVLGMSAPGGKEKPRERSLSEDEIETLWETLEKEEEPVATLYRMMLLTGQRPGEVKQMRWDQIKVNLWTIPSEVAKNGMTQILPLPRQAMTILDTLRSGSNSDHVFPSPRGGHIKWLSKATERICERAGFKFQPRDLRRTVSTQMAMLGVSREHRDKVLNHKDNSVTAVHYTPYDFVPEKRQAMERWGSKLDAIVSGEPAKVVNMR